MNAASVLPLQVSSGTHSELSAHAAVVAEQNVLGSLLIDPNAWASVADLVKAELFSRPDHQLIFGAISTLHGNGHPHDVVTTSEYLRRGNELDNAGGFAYLGKLARETCAPANARTYAEIMRSDAVRRELIRISGEMLTEGTPPAEILAKAQNDLARLPASAAPRPTPLVRPLPPADAFPLDALGAVLGPAAQAIIDIVQVPAALAGNAVLAAAGLCAQPHANVETLGGARPLSLYMMTIADSGERKSTADRIALQPVANRVRQLALEYRTNIKAFEAEIEGHKVRAKKIKEEASDADAVTAGLKTLKEPRAPRKPFMICTEPSAEGLIMSLQDGQLSQGLFSDEAGSFIGGHALSEDAELRTIATLSRVWDGSALDRVRAKDREHTTLHGRRLSLHLMAQPDVAARMIGNPLYRNQGFLARFLIAQPASIIGTRHHDGHVLDPGDDARIYAYWRALATLLNIDPAEDDELGGLSPPSLRLSEGAHRFLVESYNAIEADQREDGPLFVIRDFASKSAEHACRIAGVLTLVSEPDARLITEAAMEQAFQLVQFYLGEQMRLAGHALVSIEAQNAERLLQWIRKRGLTEITARKVMQFGPNSIRESPTAKAALRLLTSNGWLMTQDERDYRVTTGARDAWREESICTD